MLKYKCTTCYYETELEKISGPGAKPGPGDTCVCQKCGSVSYFNDKLEIVAMSDEQIIWFRENKPMEWSYLKHEMELVRRKAEMN